MGRPEEVPRSGAHAFVRGNTLTEALAKPALAAAEPYLLPANRETTDRIVAQAGSLSERHEGVLCHPSELFPLPFEMIFETPQAVPVPQQSAAAVAALEAILHEYRQFLAYGQNL